jgi:hypothetical protein
LLQKVSSSHLSYPCDHLFHHLLFLTTWSPVARAVPTHPV